MRRGRRSRPAAPRASPATRPATAPNEPADPFGDAAGGVFARWNASPALTRAATEALERADHQAHALQHLGVIVEAMRNAMRAILISAGYEVLDEDDIRVLELRIVAGPVSPTEHA